jgi:hypothetical protein
VGKPITNSETKRVRFSDRSVVPWNLRLALGRSQCFRSFSSDRVVWAGSTATSMGILFIPDRIVVPISMLGLGLLAPMTALMGGTLAVRPRAEPCLHC